MAARAGMAAAIAELRARTHAGTADYTIGAVTYWTDEQLQAVLDGHREDVWRERLARQGQIIDGATEYRDYYWSAGEFVETADSGTPIWRLEDSRGSAVGTASYTVNARSRHIRFGDDQGGTIYFLTYRRYDLDRAAAAVWEQKAAHVADRYDVATDNHKLSRSQLMKHCQQMAAFYRAKAPARTLRRRRGDV